MLAQLLRGLYFVQILIGATLGATAAVALQPRLGHAAWGMLLLGAITWVLLCQAIIIAHTMLASRPGGATLPWLRAAWGEYVCALRLFAFSQPWCHAKPEVNLPPKSPDNLQLHVPVLLVHGFVCNHRVWDKITQALHAQGHPTLAIDLEPLFTSIDTYANQIEQAATELCQQTGAKKVAMVGHSMGGLAIRAWLRAFGSNKVSHIITLGTPHQGTQVLQSLKTPNGLQMAWQSQWLADLSRGETPDMRQLMHLALTEHDNIVYPQLAQTLVGAKVTRFTGVGHLQMCCSDAVVAWLLKQLQRPTAVQAAPDSIK